MIEKIREREKFIYAASLIVLLAFFTQLFNFPNKLAVGCMFLICAVYFLMQKKAVIGLREILLFFTMLTYIWFSGRRNLTGISIVLLPLLAQMTSQYLMNGGEGHTDREKRIWMLLGVFVIGYTIHAVLNARLFLDMGPDYQGRYWLDFWTRSDTPATQHNMYFLPVLAVVFPAILYIMKQKAVCIITLAAAAFSIWFSAISQSRTPLVIFVIVFVWGIFLWVIFHRRDQKARKIMLIGAVVILAAVAAGALFVWLNFDTIQTTRIYTTLHRDGGILHNVRFEAQRNAIRQLFDYPWGGYQMELAVLEMAHNVWLDMAKAGGLLPFAGLVIYTLLAIYDMVKLLRNANVSSALKYVISGLWIALMLYYMIEPALEATVQFIVPWTYINGIAYMLGKTGTQIDE